MGITPTFKQTDVVKRFEAFLAVVEKRAIDRLKYLGEQCVKTARENGDYIDQTGNLRASVGYVVFSNGIAIHENFKRVTKTNETTGKKKRIGKDGVLAGSELAKSIAGNYKKGYVLVVVAGMNYAVSVESRGRDVLTSTEIYAKQMLPVMLEQLKNNISKATKSI